MSISHAKSISPAAGLAFQDTGGSGAPVVLLPGAGDIGSGYAPLVDSLRSAQARCVVADLPGHGESPLHPSYGVEETAAALLSLIDELAAGPAVVVATSFSPAAAVLAAHRRPDALQGLVSISPHMEADPGVSGSAQRLAIRGLLRGPWAGALWGRLYRSWYQTRPPDWLDSHVFRLQAMLADPERRRAVRETLTAGREGVAEALDAIDLPLLFVFGEKDNHFPDPAAEAAALADRTGGESLLIPGAGHYPHIEYPESVGRRILAFLDGLG